MGKFILSYIIKRSAGCALRRTMKLSYATAAGARMCEAHSLFFLIFIKTLKKIFEKYTIIYRKDLKNMLK